MGAAGLIISELVRAALVMALLALSFTHAAPLAIAKDGPGPFQVTASADLCGGGTDSVPGAHAPCHACRVFWGIDLPPSPTLAVPCVFAEEPVVFEVAPVAAGDPIASPPPRSRAPPATA